MTPSTNLGNCHVQLAAVSARECVTQALGWRLPTALLPSFLHETTHWWCLTSPVGGALSVLNAKATDALLDERRTDSDWLLPLWGAYFAGAALLPLLEGLALFAEHDVAPGDFAIRPEPFSWLSWFFLIHRHKLSDFSPSVLDDHLKKEFEHIRLSPDFIERKAAVLSTSLTDPTAYLLGYLLVKNLHEKAKARSKRAADTELFLTYLRSYFFEDLDLAQSFVSPSSLNERTYQRSILNHIAARLDNLTNGTLEKRLQRFESEVERLPGSSDYRSTLALTGQVSRDDFARSVEKELFPLQVAHLADVRENKFGRAAAVWAGVTFRRVIPIASDDGRLVSGEGGRQRFLFSDGEVDLGVVSRRQSAAFETDASFLLCFLPQMANDLDGDVISFSCHNGVDILWFAFLAIRTGGMRWIEQGSEGWDKARRVLDELRVARLFVTHPLQREFEDLKGSLVKGSFAEASKNLGRRIENLYAPRALSNVKPGLVSKCRAELSREGFWGPLKMGASGDAVRALALAGLCSSAGLSPEGPLQEFGLGAPAIWDKIGEATHQYGLPLCHFGSSTRGSKVARCFP